MGQYYVDQVAMEKLLSESDTTHRRLEFPKDSLRNFPMPAGQNYFNFVAMHMQGQPWQLKVSSTRKEGKHKKPWMSGQWRSYVLEKGLKKRDRVKLIRQVQENGVVRSYRIKAERNLTMGIWILIEEWQARNGNN